MNQLEDFIARHKKWADAMFPDETTPGKLEHLKKEIDELLKDLSDRHEWADCGMLLFNAPWRKSL